MDEWTYLGLLAGALTSTGYLPQVVKGYATKRMHDVSILMPAVLGLGMALWMVYGVVREDVAIVVANVVGTALTAMLVCMKVYYDRRGNSQGEAGP